jgi:hypothetical protein
MSTPATAAIAEASKKSGRAGSGRADPDEARAFRVHGGRAERLAEDRAAEQEEERDGERGRRADKHQRLPRNE